MEWQWALVLVVEALAVGYLVYVLAFRRSHGPRTKRPDVPLSNLRKKKPRATPDP